MISSLVDDVDDATIIARSSEEPELFATVFDRHFTEIHAFLQRRIGEHADDANGQFGLDVIALDADGRIAAELAAPRSHDPIYRYGMLTQKALENALAEAGG